MGYEELKSEDSQVVKKNTPKPSSKHIKTTERWKERDERSRKPNLKRSPKTMKDAALLAAPLAILMPLQNVLQKKVDSVAKRVKDSIANRKAGTKRLEQKWANLVAKKDKERVQQSIKNKASGRPPGSTTSTSSKFRGGSGGGIFDVTAPMKTRSGLQKKKLS